MNCGAPRYLTIDGFVLELKSVERITPLHEAHLLTYLRLTDYRIGLSISFNTVSLADGTKRYVL